MSAIAGIYYLDGRPVDRVDLGRMVDILAHRGPDGAGVWSEGNVGLGHRMLWTTPESLQEQLPLVNNTSDLVITADARIDNRDELISVLGLTDRLAEKITDSQLILSAYERWGESCPEHLLGDFTFAIWDGRKQVLFCARDHFGVKPFYYYYRSDWSFVFASEIKALLCLPEVPRRLNEVRVANYLADILEDKTITFYRDIFRLPSSHSMSVSREKVSVRSYWSLDPSRNLCLGSDNEYAEAFCELFTEAVRCRLRTAFPVGSALSGGLDSSSIVCVARKILAQDESNRLHTFSAISENVAEGDDPTFIKVVVNQGGVEPHYVYDELISPLADLDRLFHHQDEPYDNIYLSSAWALSSVAQQQGVRVLLDGNAGDFTVSYDFVYLTELARTGRWIALAREVTGLSRHYFNNCVSPRRLLWLWAIRPLVPQPVRQAWQVLRGRNGLVRSVPTIINPDFAERFGLAAQLETLKRKSRAIQTLREEHWLSLSSDFLPLGMETADKVAAAFSIELRYPFLDKRLVEFCLALPREQKIYLGWTRIIVRRALANILPEEVQWRGGKGDVSLSFARGLLMFERERLEDVILNAPKVIEEYVDIPTLRNVYQRYVDRGTVNDAYTIWTAVILALWLRLTGLTASNQ
jgi:asparagine synthase (glutamine-hydrolysing)